MQRRQGEASVYVFGEDANHGLKIIWIQNNVMLSIVEARHCFFLPQPRVATAHHAFKRRQGEASVYVFGEDANLGLKIIGIQNNVMLSIVEARHCFVFYSD